MISSTENTPMHFADRSESTSLTISGFAGTADLLTLKSNQFIFVPSGIQVVNLVKFPQWFVRYRVNNNNNAHISIPQ